MAPPVKRGQRTASARRRKAVPPVNATSPAVPVAFPLALLHDEAPRPLGVTFLGVALYVLALAAMILGVFAIVASSLYFADVQEKVQSGKEYHGPDPMGQLVLAVGGGLLAILGGLGFFVLGNGTLRGRTWAWTGGIVVAVLVGLPAAFVGVGNFLFVTTYDEGDTRTFFQFIYGVFFPLLVAGAAALAFWYYFEPKAKTYFGRPRARAWWQKKYRGFVVVEEDEPAA